MRLLLHQERSDIHHPLKSRTLLHLLGWIEALDMVMNTDDCPFSTNDELAMQLEKWRAEFQKNCGNHTVAQEDIKVMTYGEDVILICKELTSEYIKLTLTPSHHGEFE